jgi:uncharacterized protein
MAVSTIHALLGGLVIGLAAAILFGLAGRIAGISGILYGGLTQSSDRSWRWLFVIGLLIGGFAYHQISGLPAPTLARDSYPLAIVGGLLVGIGVRRGSGCTSGHGVCGIARFSKRSIFATLTFMGAGVITATLVNMVLGGFQ